MIALLSLGKLCVHPRLHDSLFFFYLVLTSSMENSLSPTLESMSQLVVEAPSGMVVSEEGARLIGEPVKLLTSPSASRFRSSSTRPRIYSYRKKEIYKKQAES